MIKQKCEKCGLEGFLHRHHKFSNSKLNRRLYGTLLDDPKNIQYLCVKDHLLMPLDKYTEIEFCKVLDIMPRSKTGIEVWQRMIQSEWMDKK